MKVVEPIRPELLAAKIEKIHNFEYSELLEQFGEEPQLIPALWFLQWVSQPDNYAGGLARFVTDFINARSEQLGTAHMAKAKSTNGRYNLADAIQIFRDLPSDARSTLFRNDAWLLEKEYVCGNNFEDWSDNGSEAEELSPTRKARRSSHCNSLLLSRLTEAACRDLCRRAANDGLAAYFKRVCEVSHVGLWAVACESGGDRFELVNPEGPPWYFASVADALLAFMAQRAEAIRASIADTEITQLVTRWIQKSRNTRQPVTIVGNSRSGKTEAVEMNAAAAPGECRLVQTPESTAIGDLLRCVAQAYGLQTSTEFTNVVLRERIAHVSRFSGLQLIFDESQFLLPSAYSRNTAPARLNWVRRALIDRGIPVVFVCTPQYEQAKRRFVKATGFAMEQFDERILKTLYLPDQLRDEDVLAVIKVQLPEVSDEEHEYIASNVITTERNFMSDLTRIAFLARDNAREAGRKVPNLADIEAAMAEVLPTKTAPAAIVPAHANGATAPDSKPCTRFAKPMRKARKPTEKPFPRGTALTRQQMSNRNPLPIPTRETRLAMIDT